MMHRTMSLKKLRKHVTPQCRNKPTAPHDDYHINNRHREDRQTYIAKYVHNKELFLCLDELVCDSDTAPS